MTQMGSLWICMPFSDRENHEDGNWILFISSQQCREK
jgi:hypothetical protein